MFLAKEPAGALENVVLSAKGGCGSKKLETNEKLISLWLMGFFCFGNSPSAP